jgi:hypothetical protein
MAFSMVSSLGGCQVGLSSRDKSKGREVVVDNRRSKAIILGNMHDMSGQTLTFICNSFSIYRSSGTINSTRSFNSTTFSVHSSDVSSKSTLLYNSDASLMTYIYGNGVRTRNPGGYIKNVATLSSDLNSVCQGPINVIFSSIDQGFSYLFTGNSTSQSFINSLYTIGDMNFSSGYVYNSSSYNDRMVFTDLSGDVGVYNTSFTAGSVDLSGVSGFQDASLVGLYPASTTNTFRYDSNTPFGVSSTISGEFIDFEFPNPVILKQFEFKTGSLAFRTPRIIQFFGRNFTSDRFTPITSRFVNFEICFSILISALIFAFNFCVSSDILFINSASILLKTIFS